MGLKRIYNSFLILVLLMIISCTPSEQADTDTILMNVDGLMASGNFRAAYDYLSNASTVESDRLGYSSIVKRALVCAEKTSDYETLADIGKKIVKNIPNEEFYAVYVYGLLHSGKFKSADSLGKKYLISNRWDSLKAEVAYREFNSIPLNYGFYPLLTYDFSSDSSLLLDQALQYKNAKLLTDYILLELANGRTVEKLDSYLQSIANTEPDSAAKLAMFFNMPESIQAYTGTMDDLLAIELLLMTGNYHQALPRLASILQSDPDINWQVYYNYLYCSYNVTASLDLETLYKAMDLYPSVPQFKLLYADTLRAAGSNDMAQQFLQQYYNNNASVLIKMYYDYYFLPFNSSRFTSYLWENIYEYVPETVYDFFMNFFFTFR